jgi:hypothetical protein
MNTSHILQSVNELINGDIYTIQDYLDLLYSDVHTFEKNDIDHERWADETQAGDTWEELPGLLEASMDAIDTIFDEIDLGKIDVELGVKLGFKLEELQDQFNQLSAQMDPVHVSQQITADDINDYIVAIATIADELTALTKIN